MASSLAVDHQFEAFGEAGFGAVHLGEGRHFHGIVGDEGGLHEGAFAERAEDFVDELAFAHGVVYLHLQLLADVAYLVFRLSVQVVAGLLGGGHGGGGGGGGGGLGGGAPSPPRGPPPARVVAAHHPVVVLVLHVQLHAGELGVVGAVHAFVAEVLPYLVHAFEAAHDEAWKWVISSACATRILFACLWVVDFPMFEWSEEEGRLMAMHHPFTHPKDEDIPLLDTNPAAVRADAYDMVINGVEVGGGSIRIHDSELQAKMFEILGFTPEKAQEQFGFLMNAFKFGAPPHGGLAYGLDRWVSLFAGLDSIRDCIAFPKNNSGRDVMLDAPGFLDQKQLDELNLKIDIKE